MKKNSMVSGWSGNNIVLVKECKVTHPRERSIRHIRVDYLLSYLNIKVCVYACTLYKMKN